MRAGREADVGGGVEVFQNAGIVAGSRDLADALLCLGNGHPGEFLDGRLRNVLDDLIQKSLHAPAVHLSHAEHQPFFIVRDAEGLDDIALLELSQEPRLGVRLIADVQGPRPDLVFIDSHCNLLPVTSA